MKHMKVHLHVMELDIDTKKTNRCKNGVSLKMSMPMKQQGTLRLRSALRCVERIKASHNQHHHQPTENNRMTNKSKSKE
jgi:hypothetical protein